MKRLSLFFILWLISMHGEASSWNQCFYETKVLSLSKKVVKIQITKLLVVNSTCEKPLTIRKISLASVEEGKKLLSVGQFLRAESFFYSAMTESGPQSSQLWKFMLPSVAKDIEVKQ